MQDFQEIKRLFGIRDDTCGFGEDEIVRCEQRLGRRLPQTLRRYYRQLGADQRINQTQDNLISPIELEIEAGDVVVFYRENQAVWSAGLKIVDFALDDPPVYLSYDQQTWEEIPGGLRNFLTAEGYLQALFALPFAANRAGLEAEKTALVRRCWRPVAAISALWGTTFYQNSDDEILALMTSDDQIDLYVAARDEIGFRRIVEKIEVSWDYNSLEDE